MSLKAPPMLVTVMGGYAKGDVLTPLAQRWIEALRLISVKIILVFDQDHLDPLPDCSQDIDNVEVIVERHGAYDFGSYRRGLAIAEERGWLNNASHVLLCNDSMIGPFWDLQQFVGPMLESGDQLWGVSDSTMYRPHLQSYFLLMRRDVFIAPAIRDFFKGVIPQPSRHDVIQSYELGFSRLVCELGFTWHAFLSSDQMLDPRNGELMGNITAYPLCMLQKGAPLIKVKALTDPRSNYDGLSRTCIYLSLHYPELWKDIWNSFELQALWQSTLPVGIILHQDDCPKLSARLAWIQAHPHSNLKAIVAVDEKAIELRARVVNEFEDELDDGLLSVLIVDDVSDIRASMIKMIVGIGTDWVVFSDSSLWSQPGALQCQIRRLIEDPSHNILDGSPALWSQKYCLTKQGLRDIFP